MKTLKDSFIIFKNNFVNVPIDSAANNFYLLKILHFKDSQ